MSGLRGAYKLVDSVWLSLYRDADQPASMAGMESKIPRVRTGFEFPVANWLDTFDVDEPRTQWFFDNCPQDHFFSRAWVAPAEGVEGLGLSEDEDHPYEVFTNPRSALLRMEKLAIVFEGRVVREWPETAHRVDGDTAITESAGHYYVYSPSHGEGRTVHLLGRHVTYETALAAAVAESESTVPALLVARILYGESLWR